MPRPVFDINEYELRGIVPEVYTEEQKALLNKTLARVNGQIDWSAQMLGFNGPGYWGRPSPKADGSYDWIGLPETMNEKRQMQVGAFGVFNKHLPYEEWPAPFNRTDVKASADAGFHVWERDGKTLLGPLGQPETLDYTGSPAIFSGGTYIFDKEMEFTVSGPADSIWYTTFFVGSEARTRLKVKDDAGFVGVRVKDSPAKEALLETLAWIDPSDWNYTQVTRQFLGMWGNKGASISFDHAFDSLDIHGFDERFGLTLNDINTPLTLDYLLARVGLEPTEWTKFANTKFGFKVGGCEVVYPLPPTDLTDPTYPQLIENNFKFYTCEDDCNYTLDITQSYSDTPIIGIGAIAFKYNTVEDCSKVSFPCVEWVFDPTLDNGTLEDVVDYPTSGPWATANEGEYDRDLSCYSAAEQGSTLCAEQFWCSFDEGEFDKQVAPGCDLDPIEVGCEEADGGFLTILGPPDYDACNCAVECCEINNGLYVFDEVPYVGPEMADGGDYLVYSSCVIYDNDEFDYTGTPACVLDNGDLDSGVAPSGTANSREYNRVLLDCEECFTTETPETIPCPPQPVHVNLEEVFSEATWSMVPSVRNSEVPLRLWNSRPLTALDEVPAGGTTQYNYLVADENQGPDELGAYRHFARLPIEYVREGKDWTKTEAVCNNQSYFSAPPNLSETSAKPAPIRPAVYSEDYNDLSTTEFTVFYEESFLVSTNNIDGSEVQEGFADSQIGYDSNEKTVYAFAVISDYDALESRIPFPTGEWRGSYYFPGVVAARTGFLYTDLETQTLQEVPYEEQPVYDMSLVKRPNVEFPDSTDLASVKNYVVSYAYFVSDFSAADDPVFDPQIAHCWRQSSIACATTDSANDCVPSAIQSNTAYLLHSPD